MSSEATTIVEEAMDAIAGHLMNEDEAITGAMAETNATGFMLDVTDVTHAEYDGPDRIVFKANIEYAGEFEEEDGGYGDRITADIEGMILHDGSAWVMGDVTVHAADSNMYDDDEEE